jgi:hypothetical protein
MRQLLATMVGWFSTVPDVAVPAAPSESERRLRELQESGQVQFLP